MKTHLKIKIKSLASEAKIIRKEERRAKKRDASSKNPGQLIPLISSLQYHREYVVRRATREALLAYGFLRGRAYPDLERDAKTEPRWDAVREVAKRFGMPDSGLAMYGMKAIYFKDVDEFQRRWDEWAYAGRVWCRSPERLKRMLDSHAVATA